MTDCRRGTETRRNNSEFVLVEVFICLRVSAAQWLIMEYIELHARSAFSFLRGAATPEELIAVCAELKMPAMALLDNDGLYGAARFHLAGKKLKVKAHIGAELTVSDFKSQVISSKSQSRR